MCEWSRLRNVVVVCMTEMLVAMFHSSYAAALPQSNARRRCLVKMMVSSFSSRRICVMTIKLFWALIKYGYLRGIRVGAGYGLEISVGIGDTSERVGHGSMGLFCQTAAPCFALQDISHHALQCCGLSFPNPQAREK